MVHLATDCQAIGLTMEEGITGLIGRELGALVKDDGHHGGVFAPELHRRLVARSEAELVLGGPIEDDPVDQEPSARMLGRSPIVPRSPVALGGYPTDGVFVCDARQREKWPDWTYGP